MFALLLIIIIAIIIAQTNKKKQTNKSILSFSDATLSRAAFQTLESLEILRTTKNIDTFKSRYVFLIGANVYGVVMQMSCNKKHTSQVLRVMDEYRNLYYTKGLPAVYRNLLLHPSMISLKVYSEQCLALCYNRKVDITQEEISRLKREDAKIRRKILLADFGDEIIAFADEMEFECIDLRETIEKNRAILRGAN